MTTLFRPAALAAALALLAAPALAWDSEMSATEGPVLVGHSDGDAPMTGIAVACPDRSPSIFVMAPDEEKPTPGGWGTVVADGVSHFVFFAGMPGGYAVNETDLLGDTHTVDGLIVEAMKAGSRAVVNIEVDSRQQPIGEVSLDGFTAAYDAFAAAC